MASVFINNINEPGGLIHSYQTPVLSFRMPVRYWLTHRTLNDRKVRTYAIGTSKSRFARQNKKKKNEIKREKSLSTLSVPDVRACAVSFEDA